MAESVAAVGDASDTFTERLDKAFTHPVLLGLAVFCAVMAGLFWTLFALAPSGGARRGQPPCASCELSQRHGGHPKRT